LFGWQQQAPPPPPQRRYVDPRRQLRPNYDQNYNQNYNSGRSIFDRN
jgi:hypothetical protein